MPTLLVYGLMALALVSAIGGGVWKIDDNGFQRATAKCEAKHLAAEQAARKREQEASAKAAADLAAERSKRRIVTKEVTRNVDREVEKTVYRDRCLPDTGVCLANAAINGTVPAGCLSDGTVPAPKPAR